MKGRGFEEPFNQHYINKININPQSHETTRTDWPLPTDHLPIHHLARPAHNCLITIHHCHVAALNGRAYHPVMRTGVLILAFVLTAGCYVGFRMRINALTAELPSVEMVERECSSAPATAKVDFATQVRPIFEAKCQPCHFNGGTMYQRLPFDRAETIKTLGTKLFTRIKDESDRQLIRDFLSQ